MLSAKVGFDLVAASFLDDLGSRLCHIVSPVSDPKSLFGPWNT